MPAMNFWIKRIRINSDDRFRYRLWIPTLHINLAAAAMFGIGSIEFEGCKRKLDRNSE